VDLNFKALLSGAGSFFKGIWDSSKGVIIAIVSIFLVVKYKELLMQYLVASSKKTVDKAEAKSDQLQQQETQANNAADALVKQASELPALEQPVSADWNKK
jgi:phosphate uptake regulator